MLDEIPKLFGRGFVIGYVMPTLIFVIFLTYGVKLDFLAIGPLSDLDVEKLGRALLAVLLIAIGMLLLNRPLVRILEGYYRFNPLRLMRGYARKQFQNKILPVLVEWEALEKAWANGQDAAPSSSLNQKAEVTASAFPHSIDLVLPTSFGNTYRAYEVYPSVLYGMDAVILWPRLSSILPKPALDQLSESRARLDFHVSLFWLSALATIIAVIDAPTWWAPLNAITPFLLTLLLWETLPNAARSWGITFASMFDLYRAPLAKSLGFALPTSAKQERQMWYDVGRMMLFRRAFTADALDGYRIKEKFSGSELKSAIAVAVQEAVEAAAEDEGEASGD